jgi:hypothetical protein
LTTTDRTAPPADLAVEQWPIESLRANPQNYRRHPPGQIRALRASLRLRGFRKPIVVQTPSGVVLAGHGILEAARLEGWTTVPVAPWACSQAEARAYLAADNELARGSDDDREALAVLLDEIRDEDAVALESVGWTDADLDRLLVEVGATTPPPATPAPAAPATPGGPTDQAGQAAPPEPPGGGPGPAPGPPADGNDASRVPDVGAGRYREQYAVLIHCEDAAKQERVYNDLTAAGYVCRVVVT